MTGPRIPDTGGVIGTWAALEQNRPALVAMSDTGEALTSSIVIAAGTYNEHASVIKLIRENTHDLMDVGTLRFEIAKSAGRPTEYAVMDEPAAALLMTYLRNNDIVKDFKKQLVHQFWEMRRQLAPLSDDEIMHRALTISARRIGELRERVAELEPKAEFYDDLMDADGTYSFLAASKILGWGRNVMMRELRRSGVLQGNNLPYQRYEHHFKVTPGTYTNQRTGELVPTATTTVRPSGLEFLRRKLDRSSPVVTS